MLSICLLCTEESVFMPPVLHRIFEQHRPAVVAALVFPQLPGDRLSRAVSHAVALDGWRAFPRLLGHALSHARDCAVCSPPHYLSVHGLFKRFGIPVETFSNPNADSSVRRLRALSPDLIFNVQPWRLKDDVLGIPRLACVNQHCGDLIRYRGVEPVVQALLHGEQTVRMTIHTMTPEYDAGRILASRDVAVSTSVLTTYRRAFAAVPDLFNDSLTRLSAGEMGAEVNPATSPYYSSLTAAEIARFRRLGLRYL